MVQRIVLVSAALLLALLGDFRGAAAQSCVVVQAPRYSLKSETVDWLIKVASGRSCVHGVRFGNLEIEPLKLLAPPKSGRVTLEGPGFRYTSQAKYTGSDSFSLAVVGRTNKRPGSSIIRVTVSVGESTVTRDVTSPSVSFITPSNDSIVSGSVTLSAAASDNVAVANVQFFVDGVAVGSPVTATPYTTTWDCSGIGDGPHLLDVVARDTSGNSATSSINIMVENIGP